MHKVKVDICSTPSLTDEIIKDEIMEKELNSNFQIFLLIVICLICYRYSQAQTDPCANQTTLVCGNDYNYSLPPIAGVWNPPGPWGTPGSEAVFSYTATETGPYDLLVTNNNYYVDLFVQEGACGQNGWAYVNDIFANETNTLMLTAGTTYYFLIDDENTTTSSGIINISCPCIPPLGGIDNSISITTNSTDFTSSTFSACNDCSFSASTDEVIEFEITCNGDYTFTLCGGATWDTYLYLSDQPCGGNVIAFNDDDCGLQSTITSYLNTGLYYLAIEGWSTSSQGDYNLNVSTTCAFSPLPVELVYFEGENIDRKNKLQWLTASELDNDYFAVERSVDGYNFEEIAIVPGNGTTTEAVQYSFIDETFSAQINYYRLKQVDFNGAFEIYNVISIQSESKKGFSIFPNPSAGLVTLATDINAKNKVVIIQNELGQIILEQEFSASNQIVLELKEDPGIYFVLLRTENEYLINKLIIR